MVYKMGMTRTASNKLRQWRQGKGVSVSTAAAEIGVTRQTWYSWERGENVPSPQYMRRIIGLAGGALSAADFYDLPTAPPTSEVA